MMPRVNMILDTETDKKLRIYMIEYGFKTFTEAIAHLLATAKGETDEK